MSETTETTALEAAQEVLARFYRPGTGGVHSCHHACPCRIAASLIDAHARIAELDGEVVRLHGENAKLAEAARKLANEASGLLAFGRECIGNTNANVLSLRVEAVRALTGEPAEKGER
jgi:hypothetical protein